MKAAPTAAGWPTSKLGLRLRVGAFSSRFDSVERPFHHMGDGRDPGDRRRGAESARPLAVGELADGSQLPKSTTSRLLSALERQGLLQRDGDRGPVRPGPVLLRFAQRTEPDVTLIDLADEHLDALAHESGATINLAVPTPLGVDPRPPPANAATKTKRGGPADPRGNHPGPLRQPPRRQCARGEGADGARRRRRA